MGDFTEGADPNNDITLSGKKCDFDTMQQSVAAWAYSDYGASHFDDFTIEFEAEITNSDTSGQAMLCCVTNTPGSKQDQFDVGDGLWVAIYNSSGNLTIEIVDWVTTNVESWAPGGTTMALRYFTFWRVGSNLYLNIYSDATRETLVHSFTGIACTTNAKRYLECVGSRETTGSATITGYTQNFNIVQAS